MLKLDDKVLEDSICLVVKAGNKDVIDNFRPVAAILKKMDDNGGNSAVSQALELGKKVERQYNEFKDSIQSTVNETKKLVEINDFIEKKLQIGDIKERDLKSNVSAIDMGSFE